MITSLITGLYVKKPDVVVVTSPQIFLGLTGYVLSRLRRIPFVFEVRDIWPQSAIDLKMLRSPLIIHLMEKLEKLLYAKSAMVIVTTPQQKINVGKKVMPPKPIECIPNGVDPERFRITGEKNILWKDGNKKGFTVAYIGTIGLSHNLEILVKAAQRMKDKNIYFFIVGDGAQKGKVAASIEEKKLKNIFMYDKIPLSDVPYALREADVGIAHERDLPMAREMYPAKMFDVMAAGKPLLIGIYGVAEKLVKENRTGIVFKSDSVDDLVQNLEILMNDPKLCAELGTNGFNLVNSKYNKEIQAAEYVRLMREIL